MIRNANNVDITQLLDRGLGSLLYDGPEGTIVRRGEKGSILTDIPLGRQLMPILRELQLEKPLQFAVKSADAFEALRLEYGLQESCPCSQWIYLSEEAPAQVDCDIRPLEQCHGPVVASLYHLVEDSLSYVTERIACGELWGLFEEGNLAGFIGAHDEGAIGMLEILPAYRRKGYGYALEAWLIAHQLRQGWIPYCHVVEGNEASIRLQKKLGMEQTSLPALWIS